MEYDAGKKALTEDIICTHVLMYSLFHPLLRQIWAPFVGDAKDGHKAEVVVAVVYNGVL